MVKSYEVAIIVLHMQFYDMNDLMGASTKIRLDKMLMTGRKRKYSNYKDIYTMPSKSRQQQKFMGIVRSIQKGDEVRAVLNKYNRQKGL